MVNYSKFLMNAKTLNENSMLLAKFDNLEHANINMDDLENMHQKQRSWLYYPESLFFPPRLFKVPSKEELLSTLTTGQVLGEKNQEKTPTTNSNKDDSNDSTIMKLTSVQSNSRIASGKKLTMMLKSQELSPGKGQDKSGASFTKMVEREAVARSVGRKKTRSTTIKLSKQ